MNVRELYRKTAEAWELLQKGQTLDCLLLCDKTITTYGSVPEAPIYLGHLYYYEAEAYRRVGDITMARLCYQAAEEFLKSADQAALQNLSCDLIALELEAGRFERSLDMGQHLLANPSITLSDSKRAVVMNNMAEAAVRMRRYQLADSLFQVLFSWINSKTLGEGFDPALTLRNFGRYRLEVGDVAGARKPLERALSYYYKRYGLNHFQTGKSFQALGNLHAKLNQPDSAEWCYDQAALWIGLDDSLGKSPVTEILPVNYETLVLQLACDRGDLARAGLSGLPAGQQVIRLIRALAFYESGLVRLDHLMRQLVSSKSGFILAGKGRAISDRAMATALELYHKTGKKEYLHQAFTNSQKAAGLSLQASAANEAAYLVDDSLKSLGLDLYRLRADLYRLNEQGSPVRSTEFRDSLARMIRKYREIQAKINDRRITTWSDGLEGHRLKFFLNRFRGTRQFIGFHDLDTLLVMFSISRSNLKVSTIPFTTALTDSLERFKRILAEPRSGNYRLEEVREFRAVSRYLHNLLVQPLVKGKRIRNQFIRTDGRLNGISFEAFTTAEPSDSKKNIEDDFKGLPYLGKRTQVTYLTGCASTCGRRNGGFHRKRFLLLACFFDGSLPESKHEVKAIRRKWKHLYVRSLDHLSDVILEDAVPYSVIHFAGHIQLDYGDATGTTLQCSGKSEDNIRLGDILHSRLDAELVYLNGCESAGGPVNASDGPLSPGLFFTLAGARGVIEHLWPAPDISSARIAASFYYKYHGHNASSSLHRAKLRYLETYPAGLDHPHYWAGVVCAR